MNDKGNAVVILEKLVTISEIIDRKRKKLLPKLRYLYRKRKKSDKVKFVNDSIRAVVDQTKEKGVKQ